MIYVTASEFRNKVGEFQDSAIKEPVAITKHGKERLVLMSAEEFRRLKSRDRVVLNTAELDKETMEAILRATPPKEALLYDDEVD